MKELLTLLEPDALAYLEKRVGIIETQSRNQHERIDQIWAQYKDPTYKEILDDAFKGYYYRHFELENFDETFRYQHNQLFKQEIKYYVSNRQVKISHVLNRDGQFTTSYDFSSDITPLQQKLVIFVHACKSKSKFSTNYYFQPFEKKEDIAGFFDFLDAYDGMEKREYVYDKYRYALDSICLVYFHIKRRNKAEVQI